MIFRGSLVIILKQEGLRALNCSTESWHTKILVVQEEMLYKDISYLELWQPTCSTQPTICAILVEGIMSNITVK